MAHHASWFARAIDTFKHRPEPPPRPHAPSPKGSRAWEESVEQHHVIPGFSVRDVGLSVFSETQSFHDRAGSNESISAARQKVAYAIINGRELAHQTGNKPPTIHSPIEPTNEA